MKPRTTHITLFLIAGLLLSVACKRKMSGNELKINLEKAMTQYLQERQPSNSPHPQFDVQDVAWFEEADYYRCEFKVKMTLPDGKDTTGIMKHKVSKDFYKVE